jgi:hypothetical protein
MYYRDPDGTVVLSFGEDEEVVVDIQLRNVGEPAYETMFAELALNNNHSLNNIMVDFDFD